jgi:hypothetical protein
MNILIIYHSSRGAQPNINSIKEHLYSFKNYSRNNCYYWNCLWPIPKAIMDIRLDCIILHTTFLCLRYAKKIDELMELTASINDYDVPVVAIPQDEYDRNLLLNQWLSSIKNLSLVCTNFISKKQILYRDLPKNVEFIDVFTSYIDDHLLEVVDANSSKITKTFDVGYRANKYGYWFGYIGHIKIKLAEVFSGLSKSNPDLKIDVDVTGNSILKSDDWIFFLMRARCILGCESGSSILIESSTDYSGKDSCSEDKYKFYTISGRHFEAAVTKTCQILFDGEYEGILKPWIHYIPIYKDFSNIDEVLIKIRDTKYCDEIANRAFKDITENESYRYKFFVEKILKSVRRKSDKSAPLSLHYKARFYTLKVIYGVYIKLLYVAKFYIKRS